MDAYSGYNQIKMHQPDEDKTTFTTGRESTATRWGPSDSRMQGLCSSEWLIKSSRTWSGAPRKFTRRYVGENRNHRDHLQHLYKFFNLLRQYKVTQSWEVHIWGSFWEVFGNLVTQWGIEANPDQISVILNMKSPICVKEVQMLNAALNQFIS